jgi:hypothetical protein
VRNSRALLWLIVHDTAVGLAPAARSRAFRVIGMALAVGPEFDAQLIPHAAVIRHQCIGGRKQGTRLRIAVAVTVGGASGGRRGRRAHARSEGRRRPGRFRRRLGGGLRRGHCAGSNCGPRSRKGGPCRGGGRGDNSAQPTSHTAQLGKYGAGAWTSTRVANVVDVVVDRALGQPLLMCRG